MVTEWKELSLADAVLINPVVHMKRGEIYPFVDMQSINPQMRYVTSHKERVYRLRFTFHERRYFNGKNYTVLGKR